MSKLTHVLLADDDENDLEMTMSALEECGLNHDINVVRDGEEALDYLYRRGKHATRTPELPGVILLDLKMPRVDGLDVLRQIKSDPDLRKIPVVMLTSSREEKDLLESYDLGVNAFVVKPVDFAQFVDAIRTLGVFWALVNETPPRRKPRDPSHTA